MIEEVISLYVDQKKSMRQISAKTRISADKVRKILLSNGVNLRSFQEGRALRFKNDIPLPKYVSEVLIGELLGDGCIAKGTNQSSFVFGNKVESYSQYLWDIFNSLSLCNKPVRKETYYHKYHQRYYTRYVFHTISTTQLHQAEKDWYMPTKPKRTKVLPDNLILTPTTVLHWYLGDGTLPKGRFGMFCSENFSFEENTRLSSLLNQESGVNSCVTEYKKDKFRIFVPKTSVPLLFEYMGNPPVKELSYKWELQKIGNINKPVDINRHDLYDLFITRNLSQTKIASIFSCSPSLVQKKLRLYGIRKRKSNADLRLLDKFIKIFSPNKSLAEMARELECSPHTINTLILYSNKEYKRNKYYRGKK